MTYEEANIWKVPPVVTKEYIAFVKQVTALTKQKNQILPTVANDILNGAAYSALRELVPLKKRRSTGAFFTSHTVAEQLVKRATKVIAQQKIIIDPACGAGDLLIAVAKLLPIHKSYSKTLKSWTQRLYGFDLQPEFIKTTKMRLALLAAYRCKVAPSSVIIDKFFTNIKVGNALENMKIISKAGCVLVNPPYVCVEAPSNCTWGSGSVNAAAIFMHSIVNSLNENASVFAVLPEVLRCGTRYKKYRDFIAGNTKKLFSEKIGVFDKWTDVDVYLTGWQIKKNRRNKGSKSSARKTGKIISDYFDIKVGPVVPHRHADAGIKKHYLDVSLLTAWDKEHIVSAKRGFTGPFFNPPFVAIRRNSRPDESQRIIATIVKGPKKPIAVENHLIVALPKDATYQACKDLLKMFKRKEASQHLNRVIRCRHLTVGSVKTIPWSEK